MTHPRKGSIVRCPLFENGSINIGLFEANPISDLCGDVESQSLDAVVLPFVGVFAKHDAPGRHVIGTPLIVLGGAVSVISYLEWKDNQRALRRGEPLRRSRLPQILAVAIAGIALVAAVLALLSGLSRH